MKNVVGYQKDLAFIHDRGYSDCSTEAAAGLLDLFRKHPLPDKRIVELGCGSGQLAQILLEKGFTVTGIDSSREMISLARRNAPKGDFAISSLWDYHIPQCGSVISVGEVLNYQFDGIVSLHRLRRLFSRVYHALLPSGIFVFDILCARTSKKVIHTKSFNESDTWFVAVEKSDSAQSITRRIISFRKENGTYTKSIEIHKVRRYNLQKVISQLRKVGFTVSTRSGYRRKPLGPYHKVIIGIKTIGTNGA